MKKIYVLENIIRSLIESDVKPSTILCAFHNVCAHGEVFDQAGYCITDDVLEALFDGFDISLYALREMEG